MEKLFKKYNAKKLGDLRKELSRAHLIIALLSLVICVLLIEGSTQPVLFDPLLATISIVLLLIVGITSLVISTVAWRTKK